MKNLRKFLSRFRSLGEGAPQDAGLLDANASMQALLMASQTMTSLRDMDEVLGFLLGEIQRILRVDCGVLMLDADRRFRVRCHRNFSADFVNELSVPLEEGPIGNCFSTGKPAALGEEELRELQRAGLFPKTNNGWASLYLAPLRVQNQDLGVFLAASNRKGLFDENMREAMDPFVQVLSVGMRNAQLFERMEKFNRRLEAEVAATTKELLLTNNRLIHRVRELKALYEITLAAGTSAKPEEVLEIVASRVQDIFSVESVGFFVNVTHKEKGGELMLQHPSFRLPKEALAKIRIEPGQAGECGAAGRTILEAYQTGEVRVFRGGPVSLRAELPRGSGAHPGDYLDKVVFRSAVAVPLTTSQKCYGVMVLLNRLKEAVSPAESLAGAQEIFAEEELRTLTLMAARVASAIESARLDNEAQKRLEDLSTLKEISDAFYATPILEFVLGKIVKIILRSLPCDLCTFLFFEPSLGELITQPYASVEEADRLLRISLSDDKAVVSQVFREGKSRIVDEILPEDQSVIRLANEQDIRSMMFVPLRVENEVIGLLRLGSREKAYFNQHHLKLSELIAERAAVIVQNARLYEKILRANKELERLNRVKTEFVSMVSHELRTPVTAIKGFVDVVMMEEAGPLNEQQKRFLKIAHSSIDRLTLLISDLLDFSQIEAGQLKLEMSPLSMRSLLEETIETYKATVQAKQLKLALEAAKKLPLVNADGPRIKQVIDNLLSNAMKFTSPGGRIHIVADDMGDFILVSVADTGVGIKKENHEKIFEKFFQVDSSLTRQVGGTGLGLAIVKSIIEMHGGRIWVESEPGKGSTFRFLLPRLREKKAGAKAAKKPA